MSDATIRLLTIDDLEGAFALSSTTGWNQELADWRMLLTLAPHGSFAASSGGRIVGTSIGIDYTEFGWIAMMLVEPAFRGRGLGRLLLETAMASLPPDRPIRLDATPMGRPLYETYGFEGEATLTRLVAGGGTHRLAAGAESSRARPLTPDRLSSIVKHDRWIFGGTRGPLLEWALDRAPEYAHILEDDGEHPAYCLGRRGRLFDQIGPVVAGDDDAAMALVTAALSTAADRPFAIDVYDAREGFAASLRGIGFAAERPLFRMRRPARFSVPTHCLTTAATHAEFAIFGPEFG